MRGSEGNCSQDVRLLTVARPLSGTITVLRCRCPMSAEIKSQHVISSVQQRADVSQTASAVAPKFMGKEDHAAVLSFGTVGNNDSLQSVAVRRSKGNHFTVQTAARLRPAFRNR